MLCSAVDSQESFDGLSKWVNEVKMVNSNLPIRLIVTKWDWNDVDDKFTKTDFKNKQNQLGIPGMCVVSAKNFGDYHVHEVFTKAVNMSLKLAALNK